MSFQYSILSWQDCVGSLSWNLNFPIYFHYVVSTSSGTGGTGRTCNKITRNINILIFLEKIHRISVKNSSKFTGKLIMNLEWKRASITTTICFSIDPYDQCCPSYSIFDYLLIRKIIIFSSIRNKYVGFFIDWLSTCISMALLRISKCV